MTSDQDLASRLLASIPKDAESYDTVSVSVANLRAAAERLSQETAKYEACKLQAQCWKQEAQTGTPLPTGQQPELMQDECGGLSRALASKPDARMRVREACAAIEAEATPTVAASIPRQEDAEPVGIVQALSVSGYPMPNSTGVEWLKPVPAGAKLYTALPQPAVAAEPVARKALQELIEVHRLVIVWKSAGQMQREEAGHGKLYEREAQAWADAKTALAASPVEAHKVECSGGWISVDERLPEWGNKVLVWAPGAYGLDICHFYRDSRWVDMDGRSVSPITHWQPPLAAPSPSQPVQAGEAG